VGFYSPRLFPFTPLLNLPDPINPLDGRLEAVGARRDGSLLFDLEVTGLIVGLLVDTPTLFFSIRALTRRIPFRIRIERAALSEADEPSEDQDLEGVANEIEGYFSERQAPLIEANRIQRRLMLEYPGGTQLVIEEFD